MNQLRLLLCGAALTAAIGSVAAEASTFTFFFNGPTDSGSGVLTASPTGTANQFLITGVTGTTDGLAITSIVAPGVYPVNLAVNDNILRMPPLGISFFDIQGLSYQLSSGLDINLYFGQFATGDPVGYNLLSGVAEKNALLSTVVVTAVGPAGTPEPSSLILLGTGAAGFGFAGLKRRRKS